MEETTTQNPSQNDAPAQASAGGAPSANNISPEKLAAHWAQTRQVMITALVAWFFFSFVVHLPAASWADVTFLGFPLSFYLAGQGSLIAFLAILFWFAARQNRVDEEAGVAE